MVIITIYYILPQLTYFQYFGAVKQGGSRVKKLFTICRYLCCETAIFQYQEAVILKTSRMTDTNDGTTEVNSSEQPEPPEGARRVRITTPPPEQRRPQSSTPAPPRSSSTPSFATMQKTSNVQQQQQTQQQQQQWKQNQAELQSESSKSMFDEEAVEVYDGGRYFRSTDQIGKGRFKLVYRGFDAKGGQDIAWSKISLTAQKLNMNEAGALLREMEKGLALDHPHIIKCHRCWLDEKASEINLITERFTSGSLRNYRKMFEQVEMNVIRKYTRQLLKGLEYLHSKTPPIVHGDLRCDKIYVNGYSGELKIGDLGLATLLPKRFANGQYPQEVTPFIDIKALGLCILELCTNVKLDLSHLYNGKGVKEYINQVADKEANEFIQLCLKEDFIKGSNVATELLKHPFVQRKHGNGAQKNGGSSAVVGGSGAGPSGSKTREGVQKSSSQPSIVQGGRVTSDGDELLLTGDIRGEDYRFQFEGRKCDENSNQIHFTIKMYVENDDVEEPSSQQKGRSLVFEFDPENDTVDNVVREMQEQFGLSDTDANLCAAAMREWLAREFPDYQTWDMD
eukprot:TRINITY_DN12105_c0_g1_i1.p1 TRINITY_DN12105_c0_g1~~TRINITY_DN12105_c0_g1_i1.p1  ORF type:complete len:566 (-),score=92.68 TRINITY_DN12105_c0_g1_i1:168-1865(-)